MSMDQIKNALVVLIHHNMAGVSAPPAEEKLMAAKGVVYYHVSVLFGALLLTSQAPLRCISRPVSPYWRPHSDCHVAMLWQIDVDNVTIRLRFPRFIHHARVTFGEEVGARMQI
jgi:hypothetical protein